MREIELKLLLKPGEVDRLSGSQILRDRALAAPVAQRLESTYFDTPEGGLRDAGIAVRLRKAGRQWVQTVKKAEGPMLNGLSRPLEAECLLEAPRLELGRIADHDLREQVIGLSRQGLSPVAETDFERTRYTLRGPLGGRIELAIDIGEARGGGGTAPLQEVELELLEGETADLYALAEMLFTRGPVRFSTVSKSERARLAGNSDLQVAPLRKHRPVVLHPGDTVEQAAAAILAENFAHAAANLARVIERDDTGGPHQLRVGLRRLRSALLAFRPALGRDAVRPWAEQSRALAAEAGRLRDLDVLGGLVGKIAAKARDEAGFAPLLAAISARRDAVREEVRTELAGPGPTAFCFAFPGFLGRKGWRTGDTAVLDCPLPRFARRALSKRWKALLPYGERIEELSIDERHEMRKELKKLRYMIDIFGGLYAPEAVTAFQTGVKRLQKAFGALNDAAMAEVMLSAPDAPGVDHAAAQRAAGRVIGHLMAESDRLWPQAIAGWGLLSAGRPFWK